MQMKPYKIITVGTDSSFYNIGNRRIFIITFQIREFRKVASKNFKLINLFSILAAIIIEIRRRKSGIRDRPKSNVNKRV